MGMRIAYCHNSLKLAATKRLVLTAEMWGGGNEKREREGEKEGGKRKWNSTGHSPVTECSCK